MSLSSFCSIFSYSSGGWSLYYPFFLFPLSSFTRFPFWLSTWPC